MHLNELPNQAWAYSKQINVKKGFAGLKFHALMAQVFRGNRTIVFVFIVVQYVIFVLFSFFVFASRKNN